MTRKKEIDPIASIHRAADEIARLRGELNNANASRRRLIDMINAIDDDEYADADEVGRLRVSVARAEVEIERLRKERNEARATVLARDRGEEIILQAENEHLRAELDDWKRMAAAKDQNMRDVAAALAIEPGAMVAKVVSTAASMRAEVERLLALDRGQQELLQRWIDAEERLILRDGPHQAGEDQKFVDQLITDTHAALTKSNET